MDDKFVVKDSGKREQFTSGMVRDTTEDKVDYELPMNGPMFDRWAEHLTKGAKKYPDTAPGEPNWMLASGKEELVRFRKSAVRHFRKWLRGETDEDHAAAVFFNINGVEYVKNRIHKEPNAKPATRGSEVEAKYYALSKNITKVGLNPVKAYNPWNEPKL